MRVTAQFVTVMWRAVAAAAIVVSGEMAASPAPDAGAVLAAARDALGGEQKLTAVKSFTATGRTRQVRGDNLVPIEFEISVELPNKYLRKDEIPAQESGPTASGFNGDELLQAPPPPAPPPAAPGRAGAAGPAPAPNPADAARKARVTSLEQDFARLALGMFATSFSAYPLTFTYVGEAEAPQGKADVLDGKGPNNFTLRFFVSKDTHLPIMVSWQAAPAGRGRGGPTPPAAGERGAAPAAGERGAGPPAGERGAGPPAGAGDRGAPPPPGERGARPGPVPAVENRLYFADYRDVDGLKFPFRLRRAIGADTIEETTFDRFKVNAKIDPKKFEIKK